MESRTDAPCPTCGQLPSPYQHLIERRLDEVTILRRMSRQEAQHSHYLTSEVVVPTMPAETH